MTGAQAGQNEISNNMAGIGAIQQMQAWALMNSAAAAEAGSVNPNDQAALALTKAAKQGLSTGFLANDACVIMAIIAAQSQPKAPSNTGGDQIADQSPTNTGGNQQVDPSISHTGNNQPSEQGATNTGNTDGAPDVGGNTTTTPVAEQNPDDLAYTSDNSKYVTSPKHAAGGWGTPMDLSDSKAQEVLNNSLQGGKQKYGVSDGKIYEFQPDNVGGWHGYPVPGTEAPPKVLREFLARGDISKAEYNKMIKGK